MMHPEHATEELRFLRRCAEGRGDWAEARRLTEALSLRGAFDRDPTGGRLFREAGAARITPTEAQSKAQEVGRMSWAASRRKRLAR